MSGRLRKIIFLVVLVSANQIWGQSFLMQRIAGQENSAFINYLHPFFKNSNQPIIAGCYELGITYRFSQRLSGTLLVPFTHFKKTEGNYDFYGGFYRKSYFGQDLGNIALSLNIAMQGQTSSRQMRFSLSVPSSQSEDSRSYLLAGYFINPSELEKYIPNVMAISATVSNARVYSTNILINYDVGFKYLRNTGSSNNGNTEFYLSYGFGLGYSSERWAVKAELAGLLTASGLSNNISDRFLNNFCIGGEWKDFIIKPTLYYQYCNHELFKLFTNGSLGLKLRYDF